ncbi:hypothetical protein Tco_1380329 [Tanacetum coccineum]
MKDEERYSASVDYQTPDESKKQTDDDKVKNGEEDKEGDVTNVNLEGGDVHMTEADTAKDTKDAHVTLTAATPVVQQQSSSVSDLVSKFISPTTDEGIDSILNPHTESTTLVNVPISVAIETPATTTTIPPPSFPVTQSTISSISSIVNEYLGSKMNEAVDVAIQLKSNELKEEAQAENQGFLNSLDSIMHKIIKDQVKTQTSKIKYKVQKYVTKSLGAEVLIRSTNQPQTSYRIASSLSEFELKRILMDKIEKNKSIDKSDVKPKNLNKCKITKIPITQEKYIKA